MPLAADSPLALANRFTVAVDVPKPANLGSWGKVDGLDVTFDVVEYRAGDADNDRWYAPGVTKYSTVKLSRAVSSKDTEEVRKWLKSTQFEHAAGSMVITLHDSANKPVYEWVLHSAMPVKWSVGGFDASASKLAVETLEIAHLGFIDDSGIPAGS